MWPRRNEEREYVEFELHFGEVVLADVLALGCDLPLFDGLIFLVDAELVIDQGGHIEESVLQDSLHVKGVGALDELHNRPQWIHSQIELLHALQIGQRLPQEAGGHLHHVVALVRILLVAQVVLSFVSATYLQLLVASVRDDVQKLIDVFDEVDFETVGVLGDVGGIGLALVETVAADGLDGEIHKGGDLRLGNRHTRSKMTWVSLLLWNRSMSCFCPFSESAYRMWERSNVEEVLDHPHKVRLGDLEMDSFQADQQLVARPHSPNAVQRSQHSLVHCRLPRLRLPQELIRFQRKPAILV